MAITINSSGITSSEIADGTITNADINTSAGIVASKLSGLSDNYAIPDATTLQKGLATISHTVKLAGIDTNANNYSHPTGDGNLHVPATSTTNNAKVLTAGATAGALTWETPASGGGGGSGEANVQSNWTQSTTTDDAYILNKPTIQYTSAIPDSTTSQTGLATSTQITKLDGIESSANNYSHPTGDGNLHVPATSTTNDGKVLTAGATAGSLSWQTPSGGGGGGGGWTEIESGTISTNTALLDFTGISTSYNSIRLYITKIGFSHAPKYLQLNASSSDSFTTLLTWQAHSRMENTSGSAIEAGGGANTSSPYITGGPDMQVPSATTPGYNFTMMLEIHDLQGIPYMTVDAMLPIGGTRISRAVAIVCGARIQSFRLKSAYGTSQYFTAGEYILYGME